MCVVYMSLVYICVFICLGAVQRSEEDIGYLVPLRQGLS